MGGEDGVDARGGESSRAHTQACAYPTHSLPTLLLPPIPSPTHRLSYLENDEYGWRVQVATLPKPAVSTTAGGGQSDLDPTAVHYIYICTKR
jgi:hypothetical protein